MLLCSPDWPWTLSPTCWEDKHAQVTRAFQEVFFKIIALAIGNQRKPPCIWVIYWNLCGEDEVLVYCQQGVGVKDPSASDLWSDKAYPGRGSLGWQSPPLIPELVRNDWPFLKTSACRNYQPQLLSPGCLQPESAVPQRPPREQLAPSLCDIHRTFWVFDCTIGAPTQHFYTCLLFFHSCVPWIMFPGPSCTERSRACSNNSLSKFQVKCSLLYGMCLYCAYKSCGEEEGMDGCVLQETTK